MDAHHHASPASRPSLDKIEDRDDDDGGGDDDNDLDPAKFLQSVRELSHQREREDSERYRKLEEEVEKGRQERLARRAVDSARDSSWIGRPASGSVSGEPAKTPSVSDRASTTDSESSGLGRTMTMSSSQAKIAAGGVERPSSPTKGTGGFVQSAMMRRTDSVSKRWSAQPSGNISRQNSTLSRSGIGSVREGYGGLQGSHSMPRLESTSNSREGSNEPLSRPSSSSSNLTNLTITTNDNDGFKRPALPHSRSRSIADSYSTNPQESASSLPSSPSKRLPSPTKTKSSWLESALTKPESPQPSPTKEKEQPTWMANIAKAKEQRASVDLSSPAKEKEQPAWMANIAKAKEQRASVDLSRASMPKAAEEVTTPRSGSPTKAAFGQSLLKRSESRDLRKEAPAPVRSVTPPTKAKPPNLASRPTSLVTSEALPAAPSNADSTLKMPSPDVEAGSENESKAPPSNEVVDEPALKTEEPKPAEDEAVKPAPPALKSIPKSDSPAPLNIKSAAKPDTPPKKDFRSNLKARPPPETKSKEEPEFLSKISALKKAQTQKYEAPDLLKDNILRGKSGLAVTSGPQKTVRRDELKESLLAKKDEWKSVKGEGRATQRTPAAPPQTPTKPEALAKKDNMGRTESLRKTEVPEKPKEATPEALSRFRSLQDKPKPTPATKPNVAPQPKPETPESSRPVTKPEKQMSLPTPKPEPQAPEASNNLERQTSAPTRADPKQVNETSKLASRFNPGLANILARGPPASSAEEPRSASFGTPNTSGAAFTPTEPPAEGGQLQDMRKGRAKGPKKRKGGAKAASEEQASALSRTEPLINVAKSDAKSPVPPTKSTAVRAVSASMSPKPLQEEKPAPLVASPASASPVQEKKAALPKPLFASRRPDTQAEIKPATPAKKPSFSLQESTPEKPAVPKKDTIPEFKGFGSIKRSQSSEKQDENKENTDSDAPAVKNVASFWSKPPAAKPGQPPSQIELPSKKDEEAAMRSAGLLARSPSRPSSRDEFGAASPPASAGAPPKPSKPSRIVSGQLREASANKDLPGLPPMTETEKTLQAAFGQVPRGAGPLQISTEELLGEAISKESEPPVKTLRRTIIEHSPPDGTPTKPPQQGEYTLFDECVYTIAHSYTNPTGRKSAETAIWSGRHATPSLLETALQHSRSICKDFASGPAVQLTQSHEPPSFFRTLGGILITRSGNRNSASKRYILRGRKHLGSITFDELPTLTPSHLNSAFVHLISAPKTLSETTLYLWKGRSASAEEISAARLAAMDLSETGEVVEVDDGAEFPSFLRVFGPGTTRSDLPKTPTFWSQKRLAPEKSTIRLFRLQRQEVRQTLSGNFFGMFARRPSAQSPAADLKVEAKLLLPFSQDSFEAEGLYLLDAFAEVFVLVGPLFVARYRSGGDENDRAGNGGGGVAAVLFSQALLLAAEYALLAASREDRPVVPACRVVLPGAQMPAGLGEVCRFWEEGRGFWGTGGLMAGSGGLGFGNVGRDGGRALDLEKVVGVVCGSGEV
ncbi:hypothetical protein MBLNU230_g1871t1 [Neophaeotheca triangularis]